MIKKITISTIAAFFIFGGVAFAGPWHGRGHGPKRMEHHHYHHYRDYNGYRDHYRGDRDFHPRYYRGHWNSWRDWDNYRRHHREELRDGRYYRRDGHLYFGFTTPDGFFSFSIGR